jgi:hypothetical protein
LHLHVNLEQNAPRASALRPQVEDAFKNAEVVMTIYPAEFHRRCQERWERRAASTLYESAQRMPWLLALGRTLRAELDAVEQPVSERLAAVLRELQRRTAT